MDRYKIYCWAIVIATGVALASPISQEGAPPLSSFLFWIAARTIVDLLPVSLGFGNQVTMAIPIHLCLGMLFPPWVAMAITGISAIDPRELKRQIPLHTALFNRAQLMLSVGISAWVFAGAGHRTFEIPEGIFFVGAAAMLHVFANLCFVALAVHFDDQIPLQEAFRGLLPRPIGGFWVSYVVLTGLGVVMALAYIEFKAWAVAAILAPVLFARLGLLGARAQAELSEKVRRQQQALLAATEKVFEERENERKRIAEDIHDTSLQMLAAASYGCGNATEFLGAGQQDKAREAVLAARQAVDSAIKELRESLVHLRKSSVEAGGLVETIRKFADQVSTVWGAEVRIEGSIENEPPIPVALAAVQILQEGLVNALKHGGQNAVVIKVSDEEGMVHLAVEDQGPGFDPEAEVGADHVGMRLMKERAARVGGRIEIDSRPGFGTRLEAILPGGVTQ